MRNIDKELDAVEKVLAAEDATVGPISKTVILSNVFWRGQLSPWRCFSY